MNSERLRKLRRLAGTGAFGFLVFTLSFMFSFPFDRITEQIVALAATRDLDLEVGSAGPTFGIGVSLKDVKLSTRAEQGKKPTVLHIPSARIGVSPWAEMNNEMAYSISMEALGGEIDADIQATKAAGHNKIKARELSMSELPGVREAINLPLGGDLDVNLDIKTPQNRNGEAVGTFSWNCVACVIGDGKEKLKVPGVLTEGINLPRIRLGDFGGKVTFEKGVGHLQGVHAKGPDAELSAEGEVRLSEVVSLSYIDLYVRFKLSDALMKSSDKLQVLDLVAANGKRSDGFYGFRLSGTLSRPGNVQWMKSSPFASTTGTVPGRPAPRPSGMPRPAIPSAAPPPPPPPPPPADENKGESAPGQVE